MSLDLLKGSIKGADENALKANMVNVVDPLQIQINQLILAIQQLQSQHIPRQQRTETPPPKYHIIKYSSQIDLVKKESKNTQTADPKNNDPPSFYPNLQVDTAN